ncbi:MAG: DNA replication and repair protein RecF [Bdellovibrionales bacterium]|nr:DNA replication and repair protein RecF [Bdellovibrionales bacterium]
MNDTFNQGDFKPHRIKRLVLKNIRIYGEALFDFEDQLSVLFGPNGSGKTTVLESISILGTLKSFRSSRIYDVIRKDESHALIEAKFDNPIQTRKIEIRERSKVLYKNGSKENDVKKYLSNLSITCLAPDHLLLVKSGPEERRKYLDYILFNLDDTYLDYLKRYQRAVKQKASILKQKLSKSVYLDLVYPWEKEIALSGDYIRTQRKNILSKMLSSFQEFFAEISNKSNNKHITIDYQDTEQTILEEIQQKRDAEFYSQRVLTGAHRDDIKIYLSGSPAKDVGSQGEVSSIVLALKMTELAILEKQWHGSPILLLDDVGNALDEARRTHLMGWVQKRNTQVIMTTADPQIFDLATKAGGKKLDGRRSAF